MADLSRATLPLKIKASIAGAYLDAVYYKVSGVNEPVTLQEIIEYIAESTGAGSAGITTYDAGNSVTVTGSQGITTSLDSPSGILTIIIPENGVLTNWEVAVAVSDCNYSAGTVSGGFALEIDNSANGINLGFSPIFQARTSPGTVSPNNPLQYNAALSLDWKIHAFAAGIIRIVFDDVQARASAGGIIIS